MNDGHRTSDLYANCLQGLVFRPRSWWTISVTGYGSFPYFASRLEAEDMRKHKAEWEGGFGTLRRATLSEIAQGLKHLRWQKKNGYGLEPRELEALKS